MRKDIIKKAGPFITRTAFVLAFLFAAAVIAYFSSISELENTLITHDLPQSYNSGWCMAADGGDMRLTVVSRQAAGADPMRIFNTLPEGLSNDSALFFQTKNESVRVWAGDRLVYSYGETPQRVYGHGVGALWHIAPLGSASGRVTVELTAIGGRTGTVPYEFLLGSRADIIYSLIRGKLWLIALNLVLALIGIVSLVMSLVSLARRTGRASPTFFFAMFVLLGAVWMATDSGLVQFILPDKGVIYLLFGCSFYLFCTPLAMFLASMYPGCGRFFRIFAVLSAAYALARIALYAAGVLDFEAGLLVLHIIMGIMIAAINIYLWLSALKTKRIEQPDMFVSVSVFTLAEAVSLVSFYVEDKLNVQRNGYASGFYIGIFLFAIITVVSVARRAQHLRQQAFKAEFLERRAYLDELTGLLNVKGFDDKCTELLRAAPASRCYAVADFDVNFFSQYNATNGVDAGDEMLRTIADTLTSACRPGELCARQEADHFVCLLMGDSLSEIIERIREADSAGREHMAAHMLLLSYGIVEITDRALAVPALRNNASVAKRTVKGNYENNLAIYDKALHDSQLQEVVWLSGFERSLEKGEFVIYLQPKMCPEPECVRGAEALVRRISPDGEVLPAGLMIEALEKKGFIRKLDHYVFEQVCRFQRRCIDEGRALIPISSNFSRVHLYDPEFPEKAAATADRYGIPHELLEIELTETAFLAGKDVLRSVVRRLRDGGFSVSIDDFGSGYSSLNVLKDVEVDVIKLDREFLQDFSENHRAGMIIVQTLRLAREMGLTVVAEGIETKPQLEFLRKNGCGLIQGYYYSFPLPEEEFIEKYLPLGHIAAVSF